MLSRKRPEKEIILAGGRLARLGLITARAGNISLRLNGSMLITASGSALGSLCRRDIVTVDIKSGRWPGSRSPSSELPLHRLIYRTSAAKAVVHCHPPLVNAYFCIYPDLRYLTFESRYYLGEVPVVRQKTLTVTRPEQVIAAMKNNGLVVIRNHGVFSRADSLAAALERVEILEEAVRVYAVARLFNRKKLDGLDRELKKSFRNR